MKNFEQLLFELNILQFLFCITFQTIQRFKRKKSLILHMIEKRKKDLIA